MDENSNENKTLMERVQQLEHERDELHKDIEQLCMQQAGPSYLAVATRMHFQRTASLEQEIENLKKKLAACTRDNLNLQEELSEAYRIKSQLADLHGAEVSKNMEVEKQVKFFQNCVAAAFSERDHSLMEAEKAKEKEELISLKLNDLQNRVEELTSDCHEQKKLNAKLQVDLAQLKMQNEIFKKICGLSTIMRKHPPQNTSQSDLEHELETLRKSVDNLQYKLRMGLEIENHLKKRVSELEKKQICSEEMIKSGISGLLHYHSQHRVHITKILDEGKSHLKSIIDMVDEKIGQLGVSRELDLKPLVRNIKLDENECQDVYISNDADPNLVAERDGPGLPVLVAGGIGNASEALAIALKEKVGALLLLSQQEERHLLERNVNATLQKKLEELQRNLLQVTNEKVKALMELAQLKQEYQLLREKIDHEKKRGNFLADAGERNVAHERDGKLKSLLKKTYLRRWVGSPDFSGNEIEANLKNEATCSGRRSNYSMDFARMKIENATLRESMECMEHLTSSIQRLRLSLLKAKESVASESKLTGMPEALEDIISEAKLVKTALGSSLPVSWSAEVGVESAGESNIDGPGDVCGDSSHAKIDSVSAAGFEMVELLILAAQMLRGSMRSSRDGS
ncbi:uncharacterized protein LOC131154982 isoform X2 [Malania oleifera]|uniref:uncharacterized protein LOC131154982 isoform X2 n=1 Tax=Malania oleifera TaxID=397392 RepID=UPI0025AE9604|nr:uncharacterized protein LOC131154982 isoform X2 [Malania oleifera]XP_057963835.1 uncharacterized protein LOC131154982 isoform X2 [Malania oleifera]